MNPNLELEDVIYTSVVAWLGDDDGGLSTEIHRNILNWMDRNQIIFYQP